jgi:peroxiredoxin
MKAFFFIVVSVLALTAQTAKGPFNDAEKPLADKIKTLRSLSDSDRPAVTANLAMDIRKLPRSPGKQILAIHLAGLVTEGDPGQDTLQQVATTLAESLKEQPSSAEDPYLELAQLVRYEHVSVSLDAPAFGKAMKQLEADDQRRDQLDFTLTALDGKTWTLKQLKGKVVVVNFWATWCPPCRKEMPDLDAIYSELHAKGLVILAITDEDRATVEAFLAQHPVRYPILLDPGRKVNDLFAIRGIPKTFVYDRSGHLAAESIDMRTRRQFMELLSRAGL